jgi:hypothetical protein
MRWSRLLSGCWFTFCRPRIAVSPAGKSTRSLDQVVSNSDIATPSRRAQEQEPAAIRSAKTAERFGMSRRRFLQ